MNKMKTMFSSAKKSLKNILNKIKSSKKLRLGCMITGISLASFMVAIVLSLVVMRENGKSSLYGEADGQSMNFGQENTDKELDIDIGELNGESTSGELGQNSTGDNQTSGENTSNTEKESSSSENATTQTPEENTTGNIVQNIEGEEDYDVTLDGVKYKYNEDILTFLVLGIDKNEKVTPAKDGISGGQSDGIFLIVMNPHTKKIDIIAVHRDTIARLWIYDREGNFVQTGKAQICLQHGYGDGMEVSNERAKKAISTLFYDLPIHSVTSINMGAIGMLNDAIGGVTLEAMESFTRDGYTFVEGETVTLKGQQAYYYTRHRDINYHYTASKRLERQKQYLSKAVEQGMEAIKEDVGVLVDIYDIIKEYVVTDLSVDELTYIATESLDYSFGNIYSPSGTVDTSRRFERYYLNIEEFEKMIIDTFYEKVD